ncbi:hypothetical protein N7488_012462 [Penicillium malachiteum]|nr:hypothetical protein N7488_012462 [Penicillium malachiteum]
MVLSAALALSHELGAFETQHWGKTQKITSITSSYAVDGCRVYFSYLSMGCLVVRIGCTSPMASDAGIPALSLGSLRPVENGRQWLFLINAWTELTKLTISITDK